MQAWKVSPPVVLQISFSAGHFLDAVKKNAPDSVDSADTLVFRGGSVVEAWEQYLAARP